MMHCIFFIFFCRAGVGLVGWFGFAHLGVFLFAMNASLNTGKCRFSVGILKIEPVHPG